MEISYSLRVRARNILPPFAEAVANVTLTIRDINDNAPTFSMPGGYTLRVPEAILPGTTIGTVVATDIDGGENGTVRIVIQFYLISLLFNNILLCTGYLFNSSRNRTHYCTDIHD